MNFICGHFLFIPKLYPNSVVSFMQPLCGHRLTRSFLHAFLLNFFEQNVFLRILQSIIHDVIGIVRALSDRGRP